MALDLDLVIGDDAALDNPEKVRAFLKRFAIGVHAGLRRPNEPEALTAQGHQEHSAECPDR